MSKPRRRSTMTHALRWIALGLGLALPTLSLIALGSLWLWQHGYLLIWAGVATASTLIAYGIVYWLLGSEIERAKADAETPEQSPGDPGWTPAENAAWGEVGKIAQAVTPDAISSRDKAIDLGLKTVEAVALALHPGKSDPLWQFTLPEALSLVERVSQRMNLLVRESVPLGDRLTLAQLRTAWGWRGAIETAEKAYDFWRAMRILNPATAIAAEMRERLSKELVGWGKEHLARQMARLYVEEVGRAAIDLYGGRLRHASVDVALSKASQRDLSSADAVVAEPLRILVAGQISAGKSSLVNALAGEVKAAVDALPATAQFTPYRLVRDGMPAALLIDSPGLAAGAVPSADLIAQAADSDFVLWVVAANRADREADRAALTALRQHFEARPNRRRPPMLLVLSNIDRLRPFQEWAPPYDLAKADAPKAQSIRAVTEAAAADLGFDAGDVVPACLANPPGHYNVDAIWARIGAMLPEAQRARLVRTLRDLEGAWDWGRIWSQAKGAGRVLAGAAMRK